MGRWDFGEALLVDFEGEMLMMGRFFSLEIVGCEYIFSTCPSHVGVDRKDT